MRPWRFCGLFEDGWQEVPAGLPLGAMDWFDFESRRAALVPGEGRRRYTGALLGIEGETVALEVDGERVELALGDIRKCTIKPDFGEADASAPGRRK